MRHHVSVPLAVSWLILPACFVVSSVAGGQDREDKSRFMRWAKQLGSSDYQQRDEATRNLLKAGRAAVDAVAGAAKSQEAESAWRALEILQQWSIDDDLQLARQARSALIGLSRSGSKWAAGPARRALSSWRDLRHQRAAQTLRRHGARLTEHAGGLARFAIDGVPAEIMIDLREGFAAREAVIAVLGERAAKKPEKKEAKKASPEETFIEAIDPPVETRPLKPEDGQSHLRIDASWRGGDEGLRYAVRLKNLTHIELHHAPLTDEAVKHLEKIPHLKGLQVYYGKISGEALRRLRKRRPGLSIFGTGDGYLGVNGQPTKHGFLIKTVFGNTSAQRAGLKTGDTIATFDGVPLTDLDSLSLSVFDRPVGHPFKLEVFRDGKRQTIEGLLGTRP